MEDIIAAIKEASLLAFTPATFFGAGGGLIRAIRRRSDWRQIAAEMAGGILVANMIFPVVEAHLPKAWHYTIFFLVGWGGIEMVGWIYQTAAEFFKLWALKKTGITIDELEHMRKIDVHYHDPEHNGDRWRKHERPECGGDTPD